MEIKQDMDFRDLENNCWGQATKILKEISDADKEDALMDYLENIFGDIPTLTEVNDYLAYDWEQIYEDIGMFDLETEVDVKSLRKFQDELASWKKPRMITDGDMIGYGEVSESELSENIDEIISRIDNVEDCIDEVFDAESKDELEEAKDNLESEYETLTDGVEEFVEDGSKPYKALMDFNIEDFFYNI